MLGFTKVEGEIRETLDYPNEITSAMVEAGIHEDYVKLFGDVVGGNKVAVCFKGADPKQKSLCRVVDEWAEVCCKFPSVEIYVDVQISKYGNVLMFLPKEWK
jgi:hypothetical protein